MNQVKFEHNANLFCDRLNVPRQQSLLKNFPSDENECDRGKDLVLNYIYKPLWIMFMSIFKSKLKI